MSHRYKRDTDSEEARCIVKRIEEFLSVCLCVYVCVSEAEESDVESGIGGDAAAALERESSAESAEGPVVAVVVLIGFRSVSVCCVWYGEDCGGQVEWGWVERLRMRNCGMG